MSEKIDWSKAPEGYPLWITDPDGIIMPGWHKEIEGKYVDMHGCFWDKSEGGFTVHKRPTTPSWAGEGLPPVGVVCEARQKTPHSCAFDWEKCTIGLTNIGANGCVQVCTIDHRGDFAIYYPEIDIVEFRPIRTPEQIAADEREAAVNDMRAIYMKGAVHGGGLYAIYDAGFRKEQK